MLLEMSLPLLSRLRAVSLLLKNLWGSGISEYRDQRVVRAPVPASWRQHNTGALLLEYSNIPLPHRFSNKISLEQKRYCLQSSFAIRPQTNQRFYIKIFLFNYVYLRVTGTTRKLVLEHIIILLERMQTKVTLKLPKVCKHICLVVQWQGHPTIFSENYLFGRRFEIYRIFGSFPVKFLACLPLVRFSNIKKMV